VSAEAEREVFDFECQACEHQFNDGDEGGPLYECSSCGTEFTREDSADGDSNRCPNCNKFGAKVADLTCPECQSGEVERGEFLGPLPPTPEELAAQAAQAAKSRQHTEEMMDRHRRAREAQAAAWEALDGWQDGIDPDDTLSFVVRSFKDGSKGTDLRVADAERIAAVILGTQMPEPLPSVISDEYDEARAAQIARWTVDGFARAFAGIEHHGDDLATMLAEYFGGRFPSISVGIGEPEYRAIAERVIAAKRKGQAA